MRERNTTIRRRADEELCRLRDLTSTLLMALETVAESFGFDTPDTPIGDLIAKARKEVVP
jgi:hypothetical protein